MRYFGLAKSPFERASGFHPFYINDSYREAFVALRYGIELRLGLVVLTGESGVGKSSLITLFRDTAKKNVRLLVLSACAERPAGLLFRITADLGLDLPTERRAGTQTLKKYLLEQAKAGQIVAIIIDDADALAGGDFAELKTLFSLRSDGRHLVQIVLAGTPALASLNDPDFKSLRQRIQVSAKIPPLASHEVETYIEQKLSFAGNLLRGLFQAGAVARIADYSRGIPKTIDALCDRSLRLAYLRSQDPITESIVDDAWKALQSGSEPELATHPGSEELRALPNAQLYAAAAKTSAEPSTDNSPSGKPKSPAALGTTALATAFLSWFPRASRRLTSLAPSDSLMESWRKPVTAVGAICIAALAAAVLFRPDRPPQWESAQPADLLAEAEPASTAPMVDEPAVQADPVEANVRALGETVSNDDPAPQLERRTVERPGELVYLHTSRPDDFPALEDISAVLRNEGYDVRDTRFTNNSTQGDVRFFFTGDRRAAERVKSVVEAELQARGYAHRLQLLERDGRKFRFAAPGKIEVWLPPLSQSESG